LWASLLFSRRLYSYFQITRANGLLVSQLLSHFQWMLHIQCAICCLLCSGLVILVFFFCEIILYCHVLGGMRDENDGFQFGWLDLLVLWLQSLLITLKYSAIADLFTHWTSPGNTIKTLEL
jgi:hypothetical protein